MIIKLFLFHSLIITFLEAFDGPQPGDIVVGALPNQTKPIDSQSTSKNDKLESPAMSIPPQSNEQKLTLFNFLLPLGKTVLQKAVKANSEDRKKAVNSTHHLKSSELPISPEFLASESVHEVQSTTSSSNVDKLEDKQNDFKMKFNNHSTTNDFQPHSTSLNSSFDIELSNHTNISQSNTHSPHHSGVSSEKSNKTEMLLLNHENVDIGTSSSDQSCEYGNYYCSGFLILASSIYFHRTINIVY